MAVVVHARPRRRRSPWGVDDLLRVLFLVGTGLGSSVASWLLARDET